MDESNQNKCDTNKDKIEKEKGDRLSQVRKYCKVFIRKYTDPNYKNNVEETTKSEKDVEDKKECNKVFAKTDKSGWSVGDPEEQGANVGAKKDGKKSLESQATGSEDTSECLESEEAKSFSSKCSDAYSKSTSYCKNVLCSYSKPKEEKSVESKIDEIKKNEQVAPGCRPNANNWRFTDFFPLDARNKELNECVEKYTKIDPSQVATRCAKFATATQEAAGECYQAVKGKAKLPPRLSHTKFSLIPGRRHRQLAMRWMPSIFLYTTASALAIIWVSEWREVLRYVPVYGHRFVLELEEEEKK